MDRGDPAGARPPDAEKAAKSRTQPDRAETGRIGAAVNPREVALSSHNAKIAVVRGLQLYAEAKKNPAWYAALYRPSETGLLPQSELDIARTQMSGAEYEQELECSFQAAILGSYYGALMAEGERRILRMPHEPRERVHTAWDLGMGDSTAIWFFQRVGRDSYHRLFTSRPAMRLDHYAKVLQGKPYVYGAHILPHDAGTISSHRQSSVWGYCTPGNHIGGEGGVQVPKRNGNTGLQVNNVIEPLGSNCIQEGQPT